MMEEIWKTVPDFPIYEASNLGRIRHAVKITLLKPQLDHYGYPKVNLYCKIKRRQITRNVHRLVLEAFVGPKPEGKNRNHIDGNRTNNNLDNLEYVSHRENITHKFREKGFVGSHFARGRYQAGIHINGKKIHLGHFETQEEAHQAYKKELTKYGIENKYAN